MNTPNVDFIKFTAKTLKKKVDKNDIKQYLLSETNVD